MAEYIERTEELILAMNAGARAIENTKRYHGAVYTRDVFSESPQEIPYLQAAKVLRETSDAPTADVAPVVHGHWIPISDGAWAECSECGEAYDVSDNGGMAAFKLFCDCYKSCPNCGAKMDGGAGSAGEEM